MGRWGQATLRTKLFWKNHQNPAWQNCRNFQNFSKILDIWCQHLYWVEKCFRRYQAWAAEKLQCVHLKGFSPLWVRMWLSSACFCVVEKSHCVHLCGLSPVCVSLWFSIDVHLEVAKLHCLMSALEWLFSKVRGNMIFQVLLSFCWVVALCALVWFFVSMFKDLSSKCLLRWSEMCAL